MNAKEFDKQYNCTFTKCEKEKALEDRLMQYYRETESMDNKQALRCWKSFKMWCKYRCFTAKEISRAKKNVAHLA